MANIVAVQIYKISCQGTFHSDGTEMNLFLDPLTESRADPVSDRD